MNKQRHVRGLLGVWAAAVTASIFFGVARADNFADVHYDIHNDQLVVTMSYRGTNPNHPFTLQWGTCKVDPDRHTHGIVAVVLDSQWKDAAQKTFNVTTRFSLADLKCRPVALTLKTAPNFYYTIPIPAKNGANP